MYVDTHLSGLVQLPTQRFCSVATGTDVEVVRSKSSWMWWSQDHTYVKISFTFLSATAYLEFVTIVVRCRARRHKWQKYKGICRLCELVLVHNDWYPRLILWWAKFVLDSFETHALFLLHKIFYTKIYSGKSSTGQFLPNKIQAWKLFKMRL